VTQSSSTALSHASHAGSILASSAQDKRPAAEEHGVSLEEHLEGFARDLLVEEEVLVVQDEQDRGGAGVEVL
jgi:hypothetical protein